MEEFSGSIWGKAKQPTFSYEDDYKENLKCDKKGGDNMTKYRVAVISSGDVKSLNCETREEVDQFILENNATRFRIKDNILNKVIETEKGIIGKNTDETN